MSVKLLLIFNLKESHFIIHSYNIEINSFLKESFYFDSYVYNGVFKGTTIWFTEYCDILHFLIIRAHCSWNIINVKCSLFSQPSDFTSEPKKVKTDILCH